MKKEMSRRLKDILVRYVILVLIALPNLWLFYAVFAPLTIYPLYFLFSLFFETSLSGNIITLSKLVPIELIGACIAGSAYYLLLILNLSTPEIKFSKRIKMILLAFVALLIINILRIFFLSVMYASGSPLFSFTHELFWYLGSVIFVVAIWFLEVRCFKIKKIPFYSDINFFWKLRKKTD